MSENTPVLVVAAGGLGTRVHGWAQFIPKEFYPVDGTPGITRLFEEIIGIGPVHVAIVYHPYYEQFAEWARQVLSPHGHDRYARAAGLEIPATIPEGTTVRLVPQSGPYGDLTSVFNGADALNAQDGIYVAFADNLYPDTNPLALLRDAGNADAAVLASPYNRALAPNRGILITHPSTGTGPRQVRTLIEKPDPAQAKELETEHGAGNLLVLEGRAKLAAPFLHFARNRLHTPAAGSEPKLALAIGAYAHDHHVIAVPTGGKTIDLGTPTDPTPQPHERQPTAAQPPHNPHNRG